VLVPEFGSAVGQGETVEIAAIVFGFEIQGCLHEIRAARFAKEAVADAKIVERFLEGLQPSVGVVAKFVVTRLQVVLSRVI
jgi:hypothetical protein